MGLPTFFYFQDRSNQPLNHGLVINKALFDLGMICFFSVHSIISQIFIIKEYICVESINLRYIQIFPMSTTIVTQQEGDGFYIAQFKTSSLAIFSYYIESKNSVYLIDPTIDTKPYDDLLIKRGAKLEAVFLTHYHADFLSGHTQYKVPIIMGPNAHRESNTFKINQMKDGDQFNLGVTTTVVLHTPGHTLECSCFLLQDAGKNNVALFSGDTLFIGDVGRPDLAAGQKITKEDLAGMMFQSMQKLRKLHPDIRLYPGHGAGSACGGKGIGAGNFCTMGKQFETNFGMLIKEKEEFVSKITEGVAKPPAYFFHDVTKNQQGTGSLEEEFKKANQPLSIEEFQKVAEKSKVIDTRFNIEGGLIRGSFWLPMQGALCNWLSMISFPNDPIVLINEEGKQEEIILRLLRIGYFNIQGYSKFKMEDYPGEKWHPKIVNGRQALDVENRTHLDVRNVPQFKETGVIEGSVLIPLGQLVTRAEELKEKPNVVVNCKAGTRARFAASLLANVGVNPYVIADKVEEFPNYGHKVVPYEG